MAKHESLRGKSRTGAYSAPQKRRRRIVEGKAHTRLASVTAEHLLAAAKHFGWGEEASAHKVQRLPMHSFFILQAAEVAGYLKGEKSERVGGRVSPRLLSAAKAKSGIKSQTELLEYALSKVALEDDYGQKLLARKGRVPDDVEL